MICEIIRGQPHDRELEATLKVNRFLLILGAAFFEIGHGIWHVSAKSFWSFDNFPPTGLPA